MKKKALFLDRDGVINVDKKYVHKIKDFEFCEGIFEFCAFFQKENFLLFVITNQSGIARGYYSQSDFELLSAYMLKEFEKKNIFIQKIYHCPHLQDCECRKPSPGMLLTAQKEFDLNMQNSVFIGDNLSDMQAGLRAKVGTLVLLGKQSSDDFKTFENLKEALNFFKALKKENQCV